MITIVALMKRNPSLTRRAFRDQYENTECKMVERTFGHLLLSYQRNYLEGPFEGNSKDNVPPAYDVITVMTFPSKDSFEKMMAMRNATPEVNAEIAAARARLFDVPAMQMFICDPSVSKLDSLAGV